MRSLMRASSVAIAASPRRVLGRRREATADASGSVHRRAGRRPDWLGNGPDVGPGREVGPGRVGHSPICDRVASHFPRLSTWRGYQRERPLDTVGRASTTGTRPGRTRRASRPIRRRRARARPAEEIEALRELHARLVATPVDDVIVNHALGIWQLALVHLGVVTPPDEQGRPPAPDLASAGLAIDALAALVDGLGDRLGEHEEMLRDALGQARCFRRGRRSAPELTWPATVQRQRAA